MTNNEQFYVFGNNTIYTRGFTWAASIVPRSEMVYRECSECEAVDHHPSGDFDVIVEGGTKYPDILGCGAYPFLIVSQAVIAAWRKANIECFHTYPVGIAGVKSKKLQAVEPPLYFRVEIEGKCQIDLAASGAKVIRICPECHRVIEHPTLADERSYQMVAGSWGGCPLFRDPILYPRVNFCTQKVVKIATQYRLTNFRFEPMEGPFDPSSKGIEYMKRSLKG